MITISMTLVMVGLAFWALKKTRMWGGIAAFACMAILYNAGVGSTPWEIMGTLLGSLEAVIAGLLDAAATAIEGL